MHDDKLKRTWQTYGTFVKLSKHRMMNDEKCLCFCQRLSSTSSWCLMRKVLSLMSWVITCQKSYTYSPSSFRSSSACQAWCLQNKNMRTDNNIHMITDNGIKCIVWHVEHKHTHSMRWNMKSTNLWIAIRKKCFATFFGSSCMRACVCVSVRFGIYEQIHFCRMTWLKIIVTSPAGIVLSTETATECQSSRWHMTC